MTDREPLEVPHSPSAGTEPLFISYYQVLVDELTEIDSALADLEKRRSIILMVIAGYGELIESG